ncbi:MAG TPA: hypothetical protein VE861_11870, partial [Gemmatimonadaceae bacterium]|nr:hypothetical protein [Gemmatimonadaceae bacterium]
GNVFPRGIPIGEVLRETKTVEGWARTYLIRPIVSPDAASAAIVLLPPRAAAGVTGAWSSVTATEGTQKAIVAAGDSMIADSLRIAQERLAKLALLDSLRRAAIYGGDSGVRVEGDTVTSPRGSTARPGGAVMPPGGVTPAPVTPAPVRSAPRRDSSRAAPRPRPDTSRARGSVDSARARNRSIPAKPKPAENPFRLPPAGASE